MSFPVAMAAVRACTDHLPCSRGQIPSGSCGLGALAPHLQLSRVPAVRRVKACSATGTPETKAAPLQKSQGSSTCLRCGDEYSQAENSPVACTYHGHMTGDKGLYAYAPPHQGVDGDWSEEGGVIVYVWNREGNRPNTGRRNWKRRWTCCGVYGEDAPPCRKGWHVSYDEGALRF